MTGVLRARVGGTWVDVLGSGGNGAGWVSKTGDTMTGPLTINPVDSPSAAASNLYLGAIQGGEGGQITFADGLGGEWANDVLSGQMRWHRTGIVALTLAADGQKAAIGWSGYWIGRHPVHAGSAIWNQGSGENPGSDYSLLNIGSTTFLNGAGDVRLRIGNADRLWCDSGGVNVGYVPLYMNNQNIEGINIANANGFNLYGGNSFYFASYGGGWYMTDGTWVRSTNDKSVWLGGGKFGSNGGLSLGFGGGGNDAGHIADISGYMRVTQRIDAGGLSCGDATVANLTTNYINTRDGYRITSNGSYNGWYYNSGVFSQKAGGGDRASMSVHPGGVAYNWGATSVSPGIGFWNLDCSGCAPVIAASFDYCSSERYKQEIRAWPSPSLSAASQGAASRLSLIDVVQFVPKEELTMIDTLSSLRREHALVRLNEYRKRKGMDPYPRPLHNCDESEWCSGTSEAPCSRHVNWRNPQIGVIVEDLATVLPEAVFIDEFGRPDGVRTGSMIGYLLAVCKEQQERIEALEQHLQEAA